MTDRDSQREVDYALVRLLERNIADEAQAREGYFLIYEKYFNELSMEEIWQIKEIIAEELKHSEILAKMVRKRTKIDAEE
jgi:rubrerythrin